MKSILLASAIVSSLATFGCGSADNESRAPAQIGPSSRVGSSNAKWANDDAKTPSGLGPASPSDNSSSFRQLRGHELREKIVGRSIVEDSDKTGRAPHPQGETFQSDGSVIVILDNALVRRLYRIHGDSLCVSIIEPKLDECRIFFFDKRDGRLYQRRLSGDTMMTPLKIWKS